MEVSSQDITINQPISSSNNTVLLCLTDSLNALFLIAFHKVFRIIFLISGVRDNITMKGRVRRCLRKYGSWLVSLFRIYYNNHNFCKKLYLRSLARFWIHFWSWIAYYLQSGNLWLVDFTRSIDLFDAFVARIWNIYFLQVLHDIRNFYFPWILLGIESKSHSVIGKLTLPTSCRKLF